MQKELIAQLINAELEDANKKFGDKFHSPHEGYAVILEEVEETVKPQAEMIQLTEVLWRSVKADNKLYQKERANAILQQAKNLIAEATQVAAMCQKFINSMEVENENR